jgi:hypothetical protein
MKLFFTLTLLVSVLFPPVTMVMTLRDFAHNQYKERDERLHDTAVPKFPSAHLGLTAGQLNGVDGLVADAYRQSVADGHRLGSGYQQLWLESFGLSALLFFASLAGRRACGSSRAA